MTSRSKEELMRSESLNVPSHLITLKVKFQVVGFHHYPEAQGNRRYLSERHRHLFHFQVEARVDGDNREVEFHDLLEEAKRSLCNSFDSKFSHFEFGHSSCEMIAKEVLAGITTPGVYAVEVWEDGECGARVELRGGNSNGR